MDKIDFAGLRYFKTYSYQDSNPNKCVLFKSGSKHKILIYTTTKLVIIATLENISDEIKSSLDKLAKDMVEKGL